MYFVQLMVCGCLCLLSCVVCVVVTVTTTVIHMNRLQTLRECIYQSATSSCTCFDGIIDPQLFNINTQGDHFVVIVVGFVVAVLIAAANVVVISTFVSSHSPVCVCLHPQLWSSPWEPVFLSQSNVWTLSHWNSGHHLLLHARLSDTQVTVKE